MRGQDGSGVTSMVWHECAFELLVCSVGSDWRFDQLFWARECRKCHCQTMVTHDQYNRMYDYRVHSNSLHSAFDSG